MPAQQDIKALSLVQIDKLYPLLSVARQNIALIMSRGMLADNSFERKKLSESGRQTRLGEVQYLFQWMAELWVSR